MAIVTSRTFTTIRGRAQNLVFATQPDGRIVMRSRPFIYRENRTPERIDAQKTLLRFNTLASNIYLPCLKKYYFPPLPFTQQKACWIGQLGRIATYFRGSNGSRLAVTTPQIAQTNFLISIPKVQNEISIFIQQREVLFYDWIGGAFGIHLQWSYGSSPNDQPEDELTMILLNMSRTTPTQEATISIRQNAVTNFNYQIADFNFEANEDYILYLLFRNDATGNLYHSRGMAFFYIHNREMIAIDEQERKYIDTLIVF